MDRYEGFILDQPLGCEFRRESVLVTPDNGGEPVSAWIYYYNLSTDGLPVIRDGDFVRSVGGVSA
jgi:gamma-glutamylcyclotransferase (GGCT)/AIG2-like uncharacterized protein YtfP